jgi:hypothetical protein
MHGGDTVIVVFACRAAAGEEPSTAWATISKAFNMRRHIPEFLKLAQIMLVSPATSVDNERQFSLMKLLKSPIRNRMGPEMLNSLCRIKRSGITVQEFPYKECLEEWLKRKNRRMVST